MTKKMPKEILIYKCDILSDGTPVYAVVNKVIEIPEDTDSEQVGVYILTKQYRFRVRRELI